jgi:hypothetical protein
MRRSIPANTNLYKYIYWEMTELVDVLDLGSSVEKCVGSTPIFPTLIFIIFIF